MGKRITERERDEAIAEARRLRDWLLKQCESLQEQFQARVEAFQGEWNAKLADERERYAQFETRHTALRSGFTTAFSELLGMIEKAESLEQLRRDAEPIAKAFTTAFPENI